MGIDTCTAIGGVQLLSHELFQADIFACWNDGWPRRRQTRSWGRSGAPYVDTEQDPPTYTVGESLFGSLVARLVENVALTQILRVALRGWSCRTALD